MKVTVNDVVVELPCGASLNDALDVRNIAHSGIATAINGVVVPAVKREETILKDGDKVLVIKAFYGG